MLNFWSWEKKQQVSKKLLQLQSLFSASKSSIQSSLASIDGTFCSEAKKTALVNSPKRIWRLKPSKQGSLVSTKGRQCQSSKFFVSQIFVSAIAFLFLGFLTPDFPTNLLCTGIFGRNLQIWPQVESKWHYPVSVQASKSPPVTSLKRENQYKKGVGSLPYLKKKHDPDPKLIYRKPLLVLHLIFQKSCLWQRSPEQPPSQGPGVFGFLGSPGMKWIVTQGPPDSNPKPPGAKPTNLLQLVLDLNPVEKSARQKLDHFPKSSK